MKNLAFTDLIEVHSLQMIQDSFSKFMGINLCVSDTKGNHITEPSGGAEFCWKYTLGTETGRKYCDECYTRCAHIVFSESKAAMCTCRAGMTEFAIPIYIGNNIVGTIVAGQVRSDELDEENLRRIASEIGIDPEEYINAAKNVRYITKEYAGSMKVFLEEFAAALSEMAYANYKKIKKLEKAERTARSQSEFITELTGNLRESMRGWIESFSTATRKYDDLPDVKQETDALLFRAGEVYSQIGGAVDYIRMAGGSAEYTEDIYNTRNLIERAEASLEMQAAEAGVGVIAFCDDSLPETLAGNSGRIGQIISKIGSSLISFTNKDGTVEIDASCEKTDYSCNLVIRIKGTGTRMTEKAAASIGSAIKGGGANVFAGTDKLTSKDTDFPLVVMLLKQMSGIIETESLVNGNVSFRLTIPQLDGSKLNV